MSRRRIARLNEQLKRELAELIRTQLRDPRIGPVTVTGVDVTADLGVARVFVRVVGGRDAMAETLAGLDAASPFLRGTLGRMLKVRRIPELRFQEDRSLEHARRIEELLADVLPEGADEEGTGDAPPAPDGSPVRSEDDEDEAEP